MIRRIMALCDGNPGALRVLADLAQTLGLEALDIVEANGLRGSDIWVAFKDWAKEDYATLWMGLAGKDPEMLAAVERERHPEATP